MLLPHYFDVPSPLCLCMLEPFHSIPSLLLYTLALSTISSLFFRLRSSIYCIYQFGMSLSIWYVVPIVHKCLALNDSGRIPFSVQNYLWKPTMVKRKSMLVCVSCTDMVTWSCLWRSWIQPKSAGEKKSSIIFSFAFTRAAAIVLSGFNTSFKFASAHEMKWCIGRIS